MVLFVFCGKEEDILSIGDCPIGSPFRPERERILEDVDDRGCWPVKGQVFFWESADS